MAQGPMRGAALAAVLAAVTCERARDCPRMLAVFTGPSRHGPEPAGMSRPAAERTAGRRLPAPSGPSAVPQPSRNASGFKAKRMRAASDVGCTV